MSSNYWAEREAEALKHRITDEKLYDKKLKEIYSNMLDSCQSEINSFYGRYADKNGITIATAKRRVAKADIEAYERKAKKYVAEKNFTKKANEEMALYNLMMKVNRLEMLKANIGLELLAGHSEMETFMEDILKGRTVDELERQAGILGKTIRNNAKTANAIVNASFHNATFSDRIWLYQDLLKDELDKLLQSGLIQGKNPRVLARELEKTFGASRFNAERLMRTELARVQTEAQRQSFEKNGFEMYTFHTNTGCCDVCAAINGKHYKVKDMQIGENAPPMHPHCRCSTSAYEDSAEYNEWLDFLANGGTTEEYNKLKLQPKAKQAENKAAFAPAQTLKEATQRISDVLGVDNVSLGKMPVELANQYLEGIERFMKDFPMLKGYYTKVGTKLAPNHLGVNKLNATYNDDKSKLKLSCELNLRSAKDYNALLKIYKDNEKSKFHYKNCSPLATAIHELVHGIDHATALKKCGGFGENGLGEIDAKEWKHIGGGISYPIIKQVKEEMFGKQYGKDVYDATAYLGSYSLTANVEMLAEAISYEYVNETNPYSARILELFKEKVNEVFKDENT